MPYIGKSPSAGVRQRYQYTATAGQTTFSGTDLGNLTLTYTDNNFVDVFQNGVLLKGGGTDYTATSGTSVVLATGASVSDVIEIIVYDVFSVGNFFNRTDSDSRYVNVDGDTMTGTLTLSGAVAVTGDYSSTTSGTSNLRLGVTAGNSIASGGNYNTLIGDEAGADITTGDNNTCVGTFSGREIIASGSNTAVGSYSMYNMTHGGDNVAIGTSALDIDTKGSRTVAVGRNALGAQNFTSETDTHNTAVGYNAGLAVTDGTNNTILGAEAGITITSAASNTFVGHEAGQLTNADKNTFVGRNAGHNITSGAKNTIIGRFNGNENGFDIRTKSNNIVLSDGDGVVRGLWEDGISYPNWKFMSDTDGQFAMVIQAQDSSNPYGIYMQFTAASPDNNVHNFLTCADNSTNRLQIFSDGDVVNHDNSYGAISDIKLKEQIVDASSQWDDVKALKVRKFKMKEDVSAKGDSDDLWRLGVIAQELETAGMNGLVETNSDIDYETKKDLGTTTKSVKYSVLYMKAVKALQEAMTRIEALETKNDALEARIKKLEDG